MGECSERAHALARQEDGNSFGSPRLHSDRPRITTWRQAAKGVPKYSGLEQAAQYIWRPAAGHHPDQAEHDLLRKSVAA
jgi:hypothetical protein